MNKKIIYAVCLPLIISIISCSNEDTKKPADQPKDSTTSTSVDSTKKVDSSAAIAVQPKEPANPVKAAADSARKIAKKIPDVVDKTKDRSVTQKAVDAEDSVALLKKKKKSATTSETSTQSANVPVKAPDNSNPDKPFVPKYGIIPRNATETNITAFINAFPDKTTFVKVNYDADPDSEMQGVRTQIIKVLKKLGYTNIADLPTILHPMHMPKDIHYELQHDGSVVIWVPVADTGQN